MSTCTVKATVAAALMVPLCCGRLSAEPPHVSYVFPAGTQRGTAIDVRVGGHYLHEGARWDFDGLGLTASRRINRTGTIWFEGPRIPMPASQQKEDYPVDYLGRIQVDTDAEPGIRSWRVHHVQGLTQPLPFVIGLLPEVMEHEIDGDPIPQKVTLPVTVNGRTFPREDVDLWSFHVEAGETVTCIVHAARLGSPLDARISLSGPDGKRIAEDTGTFGLDPFVRFKAPVSGLYTVSLQDAASGGLQHYVYRMTLTNGPWIDGVYPLGGPTGETVELTLRGANLPEKSARVPLPDTPGIYWWHPDRFPACELGIPLLVTADPEVIEPFDNNSEEPIPVEGLPCVLNGSINAPGQQDDWRLPVRKGEPLLLNLQASQLGSPLDSVVTILDAQETVLASNDDAGGQTDSRLKWTPGADGHVIVRIADRLNSRGDNRYVYRMTVGPPETDSPVQFSARSASSSINLDRGASTKLRVDIKRFAGKGEIEFHVEGLPEGVSVAATKAATGKNRVDIEFSADEKAVLGMNPVTIYGTMEHEGEKVTVPVAGPDQPGSSDSVPLALSVNLATPFKFSAIFESKFAPRGTVYLRHYTIDRGGFEGPLTVSLADRQVRHLQGVRGPVLTIPAGQDSFDYPAELAPWLEVGRTSRTCLMITGEVTSEDGSTHRLSYASHAQNDQIIVLTAPEIFSVSSPLRSLSVVPGETVDLPIRIGRTPRISDSVDVALIIPSHVRGVSCESLEVTEASSEGTLRIRFGGQESGPFNMPLKIRATTCDERGLSVTAETDLVFVSDLANAESIQTGQLDPVQE